MLIVTKTVRGKLGLCYLADSDAPGLQEGSASRFRDVLHLCNLYRLEVGIECGQCALSRAVVGKGSEAYVGFAVGR